jgi:transposase-like protein
MRKQYNSNEKARIVLEILRGENTMNEIAAENNVHPNLLTRWKTQAIKGLPQIFENDKTKTLKKDKEYEKEKDELYKQIGKLTAQIEWLKKKSDY